MNLSWSKFRAAAGIEPATSRTRNGNHTTRPSSLKSLTQRFSIPFLNLNRSQFI